MKRLVATTLTLSLCLTILGGCGGETRSAAQLDSSAVQAATLETTASPEPTATSEPTATPEPTFKSIGIVPYSDLITQKVVGENGEAQYNVEIPGKLRKQYDNIDLGVSLTEFLRVFPVDGLDAENEPNVVIYLANKESLKRCNLSFSDGILKSKSQRQITKQEFEKLFAEPTPAPESIDDGETAGTVYWTSGGEKYHSTSECVSLKRSKNIKHGTILQAGNREPCNLCH